MLSSVLTSHTSSPMMKQYHAIKQKHPHALLLFRMGDFYELFFEDATIAAPILDIVLTRRGKEKGEDIPMCGIPAHAYDAYIGKLVGAGHKVAICEQLESPEEAKKQGRKGPLLRDVVRIITSGTVTEETLLPLKKQNYLIAFSLLSKKFLKQISASPANTERVDESIALAALELSSSSLFVQRIPVSHLFEVVCALEPSEILIDDTLLDAILKKSEEASSMRFLEGLVETYKKQLTPLPTVKFDAQNGKERLCSFYKVQFLDAFGTLEEIELQALGALLDYLMLTQKDILPYLRPLEVRTTEGSLRIDPSTRKNLEITHSLDGNLTGSLLHVLDVTQTLMGARLLRARLASPLLDLKRIEKRLDRLSFFVKNQAISSHLRTILKSQLDCERSLTRLSLKRGGPRDLGVVRSTLMNCEKIQTLFSDVLDEDNLYIGALDDFNSLKELRDLLVCALQEILPFMTREGNYIGDCFSSALDHERNLRDQGTTHIKSLEKRYQEETSIVTLRIRYNNIIGYHIEVPISQQSKIPLAFIHRQTLSNHARYTSVELSNLARSIEEASEKAKACELEIFEHLLSSILMQLPTLFKICHYLADLDIMSSLAEVALTYHYQRPVLDHSTDIEIIRGRHPVIERQSHVLGTHSFVPNTCVFNEGATLHLMTGANMGGKSTFLRQNALIVLMAQMGCFVPAQRARIGIVDRIFSRIGASDNLSEGRSTFMVEMVETATILQQATSRSLVILDEIGRGTATYDGLAIAYAVVDALHHKTKCRTLFATHYHELVSLCKDWPSLKLLTVKVRLWNDEIIFLHEVINGSASQSYGLQVAALAGFPSDVLQKARSFLQSFEKSPHTDHVYIKNECLEPNTGWVADELKGLDINQVSPLQAFDFLFKLKERLKTFEREAA